MAEQFGSHRSETAEQLEYEQQIHNAQLKQGSASDDDHAATNADRRDDRQHGRSIFQRAKDQIKASFPEVVQDLKLMGGVAALESKLKKELADPTIFPEIKRTAHVRRGLELCSEERDYVKERRRRLRHSFAEYLDLPPEEVHPDDVPVVAFGGSGGGFRAMIGTLGYCDAMKRSGLWDCLSYVAGVSGSCWSLATYYTFGEAEMERVIEHCKQRFSPDHPLSGEAVRAVLSARDGPRRTLGPLVQKSKSGLEVVAMDLYSVFTTGHVFLQGEGAGHSSEGHVLRKRASGEKTWDTWSSARKHLDAGSEPLPILTAIRHERPWKDWIDEEHPFKEPDHGEGDHREAKDAWFQWYEMTPYEVGCDEIEAFVPTWAFGRPFSEGRSTMQLPEQSLALLLGLCTSAPAGPLTSYLATINRNLPPGFLGNSIHSMARSVARFWGKQGTEEFQNHHPLHACNEHNFLYRYTPAKPGEGRPPGLENSPRIHLIDSGMDNNCPTYVLMHPKRGVDVIINMDASSDVQKDTFPERVDQIGSRRGVKFTRRDGIPADAPEGPDRFKARYAQIYDGVPCPRPETVVDSYGRTVTNPPASVFDKEVGMVYLPLLPNERAVEGYDPSTAKFSGSYNLVWTADQVEMLVKVCRANFAVGEARVKEVMKEAWVRKRKAREARINGQ